MTRQIPFSIVIACLIGAGTGCGGGGSGGQGSPCRTDQQCSNNSTLYCSPSGAASGAGACGICPPVLNPCTSDAECQVDGGTNICERPCFGACQKSECVPGCAGDASCAPGTRCSSGHRCVAVACPNGTECANNFECASMSCRRRSCQSDAQCLGQGYCVTGGCYPELGTCEQPRG
jgi:hypothetical protein